MKREFLTSEAENYYIKGVSEGYFAVRLTNLSKIENSSILEAYNQGFFDGTLKRNRLHDDNKTISYEDRQSFIKVTVASAYKYGFDITSDYLNPEDKKIYDEQLNNVESIAKTCLVRKRK